VLPAGRRSFTVDVFQQSSGRSVVGERLVARLPRPLAIVHLGRPREPRGPPRHRRRLRGPVPHRRRRGPDRPAPHGRALRPAARLLVEPGLWRRPAVQARAPGTRRRSNRALGIAFKLDRSASATVTVSSGGRTVRTFRANAVGARRVVRFRLPSEALRRGDVRVVLRIETGG
jgi:hypothetical protein